MISPSTARFQGDPVRITRRGMAEIRQAEAERVERVCAALCAMPGLSDEVRAMYAKTILCQYAPGPPPSQSADEPAPTKPKRFTVFKIGKKS